MRTCELCKGRDDIPSSTDATLFPLGLLAAHAGTRYGLSSGCSPTGGGRGLAGNGCGYAGSRFCTGFGPEIIIIYL